MSLNNDFIKIVETSNLVRVRIALSNELLLDPRGATFKEMLEYAMTKLPDLFQENKEANYSFLPPNEWDKEFLFAVKNDLDANFSKEKLAFYEVVIKEVGKEKASNLDINSTKQTIKEPAYIAKSKPHPTMSHRATAITISVSGAVLTFVGICVGKAILTIAGGAVLVGGVVLLLTDNKR